MTIKVSVEQSAKFIVVCVQSESEDWAKEQLMGAISQPDERGVEAFPDEFGWAVLDKPLG